MTRPALLPIPIATAAALLFGCGGRVEPAPTVEPVLAPTLPPTAAEAAQSAAPATQEAEPMPLSLTSSGFDPGGSIPARFSCDGENLSPALTWSEPPDGTESFALIMDDPDAPGGTWVHWLLYDIPAGSRSLPEAIGPDPTRADGSRHGTSSFRSLGYGGPCPPGGTHRYFFKLYALDTLLELPSGADKAALEAAMQGHILGQAELMGTYSR